MNRLIRAKALFFMGSAVLVLFSQSDLFIPFGLFAFFGLFASACYLEKDYTTQRQISLKGFVVAVLLLMVLFRVNISIDNRAMHLTQPTPTCSGLGQGG